MLVSARARCQRQVRPAATMSAVSSFVVPELLAQTAAREPEVAGWLTELPGVVADLAERWSLGIGEPFQPGGNCAWVAPATDAAGNDLVLKVAFTFGTGEERDEAAGLRIWDGNGSVRLHALHHGKSCSALLLERCLPGTQLAVTLPEPERDQIVAGLLRQLWAQPHGGYQFRALTQMCAQWADRFEREYAAAADPIDPGLARAGIALFRELPVSASSEVLLCTDLHAENILRARREPWLMIDPKPYFGDPAYDVLQHMLNCDRLETDPIGLARRMAELAGLDSDRVLQWLLARVVQESPDWPAMNQVARRLAPVVLD
jgi:streptomycin 6-kinase